LDLRTYARLRARFPGLEAERRLAWVLLGLVWAGGLGLGASLGVMLLRMGGTPLHVLLALAAGGGAALWLSPAVLYPYRRRFKRELVKPLLEDRFENIAYAPLGSVGPLEVEASLLFESFPPETFAGEDLVTGWVRGVSVKFSEVRIGPRIKERRRFGRRRYVLEPGVFSGLFFVADFHKPAPGVVVAYPERWLLRKPPVDLAPVRMEDPRFERHFRVFASDRLFAFYALSPALMETLAGFVEETGPLAFSIAYGKLYLAVPGGNRLEPPLFGSLKNLALYQGFLDEVGRFLKLVEALRLNRRIWGAPF